ncbi:MAG: helix-hairpin-helix domain-containing protein [Candidatus Hydrogenedentes bacterium]|nr:helix-hairpin-helix domain-containing protein [Candidatus Hydrogenedentota bacterium]
MESRIQYILRRPCRYSSARSRARGMALVFVLWIMTILCAVAIQMRFSTHLRLQTTAYLAQSTKAHYLARAGVARVMADLVSESDREDQGFDMSTATIDDSGSETYCNVALGDGSYTLYAGTDENGEPVYGMIDEAARINVNTADRSILSNVPGLDHVTARLIEKTAQRHPFVEIEDLLLVDGIDRTTLYGEDDNNNGILDPNEDDGDSSWPPDNEDGILDRGIAVYLTTWSASKNVSSDGTQKININTASADTIAKKISQIDANEAQSIVEYRNKTKFKSIAELLEVDLVEPVNKKSSGSAAKNNQPNNRSKNGRQSTPNNKNRGANDKNSKNNDNKTKGNSKTRNAKNTESVVNAKSGNSSDKNNGKNNNSNGKSGANGQRQNTARGSSQSKNSSQKSKTNQSKSSKTQYKSTGKKAFDIAELREFADRVTVVDDKVLKGLVNINTASAEVLACLPAISEANASEIVLTRQNELGGFKSPVDLLDVQGISKKDLERVCPLITVRSDVFSVRSYGVLNSGDVYVRADAVIDRTEKEPKIVYWREVE